MFTGLVSHRGTVSSVEQTGEGARLIVGSPVAAELNEGDSVAVNGVCLTATAVGPESFAADVMNETLRRSSLGRLDSGSTVNLELPLRATDRLGGHVVQGHVDGLGTVDEIRDEGFARVMAIALEPELSRYVVEKGSIALDGISLTVAAVDGDRVEVSLIPETVERTNLGDAAPGAVVNVEVDILAKYVERLVAAR